MNLICCNLTCTYFILAVGKAFSVLSDSEKRKEYDLYGPDGLAMYTSRHRRNDENNSEEDLFDPQEIFNMFFGGGFPSGELKLSGDQK